MLQYIDTAHYLNKKIKLFKLKSIYIRFILNMPKVTKFRFK